MMKSYFKFDEFPQTAAGYVSEVRRGVITCDRRFYKVVLLITFSILTMVFISFIVSMKKRGFTITYQITSSMPKGFYLVVPVKELHRSDIVVFRPKESTLAFLQERHWVPSTGWMMKYVMAIPGDAVCTYDHMLWINQKRIGRIYEHDSSGRLLPSQFFCGKLEGHKYLLISTRIDQSFDSRYFGPIDKKCIKGKAIPLFLSKK